MTGLRQPRGLFLFGVKMSAAKQRGTRFETLCLRALNAFGFDAYRPAQAGKDVGDLNGLSPFIAQCKDWKDWQAAMREGLDGAERQKVHAGEPYGVAFVKRARRPVGDAYAVMTLATWTRLVYRLQRAEHLLELTNRYSYDTHMDCTRHELGKPFPTGVEVTE